ncbi:hypothetical protein ILUMI_04961 [Ignelater luminosus]|uniref:Peptidase S1 domain-containing protein n=1 Tax=Ignelater luminosus TaxID=2038154 RepID=A0A8K0DIN0_IGNLU|nr:hypothetical protein ILUMI_04961 [Ignelater luminosus]
MFRLVFIVALIAPTYGWHVAQPHENIVGGKDTEIEDHPYQLSFQVNNTHMCGASLIRSNVAVTAAHCAKDVGDLKRFLSVRAGTSVLHKGGQVAKILEICDHPKYDADTYDYDVSVLLLKRPLALGARVKIIRRQPVNKEVPTGAVATVTGWGRLKENGLHLAKLHEVQVPKISFSECAEFYCRHNKIVTATMVCFGFIKGVKDACEGDSGGPLVIDGMLVGVVSWGPGVYAKISHPEINSHIIECLGKIP